MKVRLALAALLMVITTQVSAANSAYGTVSELVIVSNSESDNSVYFRLNTMLEISEFEKCMQDPVTTSWHIDLSSPVADYQYQLLQSAYEKQLPVRVIGRADVCKNGETYYDTVSNLNPWNWSSHKQQP